MQYSGHRMCITAVHGVSTVVTAQPLVVAVALVLVPGIALVLMPLIVLLRCYDDHADVP